MLRSVLVVAPSWLGDMVMAHSLVQAIAQAYPQAAIDILAPPGTVELSARMPELRRAWCLTVRRGHFDWAARRDMARQIAAMNYCQAIHCPNSWKSALVACLAKIPRRTGWRGEYRWGLLNDCRVLDRQRTPRVVDRYVALAHAPDARGWSVHAPRLSVDEDNRDRLRASLGLQSTSPVMVLAPGCAYGPSKQWPVRSYVAVAEQALASGYTVWLMGASGDRTLTETINHQLGGRCLDLAGKTGLLDAVDCLSCADVLVANDSGLMHVAAAVGVAVVAIYGSTTPDFAPPLSDRASILYAARPCSPCRKRVCRYGHYGCLADIGDNQVFCEVQRWLGRAQQ